MQYYYRGFGIGDTVRVAAELWGRHPEGCTLAMESVPYDGAAQLAENLTFLEVIRTQQGKANGVDYTSWPCPESPLASGQEQVGPLWLDPSTFKVRYAGPLPDQYVVIQTETGFNKRRTLEPIPFDLPVVLIGWERNVRWPGALDLRAQLPIGEAMAVVAGASFVAGVESWVPLLGATLGKPSWQAISERSAKELLPFWQKRHPTLGHRIESWPL